MKITIKFYLYFVLSLCMPFVSIELWQYNRDLIIIPIILFAILYYKDGLINESQYLYK